MISAGLLAALYGMPVNAGSLDLPPQPIVTPPAQPLFSWTGPYAGVSAGTTRTKHKRATYGQRDVMGERPTWGERVEGVGDPYTKGDFVTDLKQRDTCDQFDRGDDQSFTFGAGQPWAYSISCGDLLDAARRGEWLDSTVSAAGGRPYEMGEVVEYQTGIEEYPTGEIERYQTGTETIRQSHATYGVFAGYRHQWSSGAVLGGELGYHHYNSTGSFEAKAQLGYAISRALPYLTAGYDFEEKSSLYGVGFDYALTDRWIAGVEYTHADKTGTDRVSARLAFKF